MSIITFIVKTTFWNQQRVCSREILENRLVFKGHFLTFRAILHKEMMAVAYAPHIFTEKCIRRAQESAFWPRMTREMKEYIPKYGVCFAQ